MARRRNPRVDKQVQAALADLIETEVADPRLAFITITEADVTPDHEVATIYYSTLDPMVVSRDPRRSGGDRIPGASEVADGLEAAAPRLRSLLGRRVKLRVSPELRFRRDPVVEQASRIDELLSTIDTDVEVPPGTGGIEDEAAGDQDHGDQDHGDQDHGDHLATDPHPDVRDTATDGPGTADVDGPEDPADR